MNFDDFATAFIGLSVIFCPIASLLGLSLGFLFLGFLPGLGLAILFGLFGLSVAGVLAYFVQKEMKNE